MPAVPDAFVEVVVSELSHVLLKLSLLDSLFHPLLPDGPTLRQKSTVPVAGCTAVPGRPPPLSQMSTQCGPAPPLEGSLQAVAEENSPAKLAGPDVEASL